MELVRFTAESHGMEAAGYIHGISPEMPERKGRPCVVVCPGGGYGFVSDRENEPVALALFSAGYQVVVLTYSINEKARELRPLVEVAKLVAALRQHAVEYHIAPDKIAVMGFSAGGHLAASLGTLWQHERLAERLPGLEASHRPNALVLCYPVITAGAFAHTGSLDNVSGGDPELRELFSLEKQATENTPPTFLWHTYEDKAVPVENSLLFMDALRKNGVPFEAHLFQHGSHGLSLCNTEVGTRDALAAPWFGLCLRWLNSLFDFEP